MSEKRDQPIYRDGELVGALVDGEILVLLAEDFPCWPVLAYLAAVARNEKGRLFRASP